MWYEHAERGKTVVNIPIPEGKESAERCAEHLRRFGWKNVRVFSDGK